MGAYPTGYNAQDPAKWWDETGKYTTVGSPNYDPNYKASTTTTPAVDTSALYPDVVDPNSEYAKYLQSLMDTTKGGYTGIDESKLQINLPGYQEVAAPDVIPYQTAEYNSGYDQNAMNQYIQNQLALTNQSLQPQLQESLAGAREDAARAGGGESTGLFSEFGRKPVEKYTQQMTQVAGQLSQQALQSQIDDNMAKAQWDREQRSTALGQDFTQKLNNAQWDREQNMKSQEWELNRQLQEGQINSQAYLTAWNAANTERTQNLQYTRQTLESELNLAVDSNNFEREKALRIELANISAESAKAQAEAQEQAGMWGGIGGLIGGTLGRIFASDRRLKQNIKRIGTHLLGIGIYEFNYVWNKVKHIGVMADEVKQVMPEAVVNINGFDAVNYSMLGGE